MLKELFATLSPRLRDRYRNLLADWLGKHLPHGGQLTEVYLRYALGDEYLPRPLLMLIAYSADRARVGEPELAELGNLVFLPQVMRDLLAIHDDVIDEDIEKFGQPTIPAAFTRLAGGNAKTGRDLAILWSDLLFSLLDDLIDQADLSPELGHQLSRVVSRALRRTQRGQLRELQFQAFAPAAIGPEDLLAMYADKAAEYCYAAPFELGAVLAGLDPARRHAARAVLEDIGVASQVIDDIAGGCPDMLGHHKDTRGEILNLRRSLLLVRLARTLPANHPLTSVLAADRLARRAAERLDDLRLGPAAREYLHDLLQVRVLDALAPLTQ
ncbi:polyprenyl synthetase family protein [Carbonactinospora thermoautotrophica]|uniref:polyprenyl synthetase family protein n=1 Tax=Carbonactinospora thermoautotrophica TaxID=1469144 RepID=UPI003DA98C2F